MTPRKAFYVAFLLLPFLGLWAFEPLVLLGAIPDLAINLLSNHHDQTSVFYYWTAGIVPFVVAASVLGAARVRHDHNRVSLAAFVGVGCIAAYSPLLVLPNDVRAALPSPLRSAKVHALKLVPADAPVTASEQLAGYLTQRRQVYLFPNRGNAEWAVIDRNDPLYVKVRHVYLHAVAEINADETWRVVFSTAGVEVLRRVVSK